LRKRTQPEKRNDFNETASPRRKRKAPPRGRGVEQRGGRSRPAD